MGCSLEHQHISKSHSIYMEVVAVGISPTSTHTINCWDETSIFKDDDLSPCRKKCERTLRYFREKTWNVNGVNGDRFLFCMCWCCISSILLVARNVHNMLIFDTAGNRKKQLVVSKRSCFHISERREIVIVRCVPKVWDQWWWHHSVHWNFNFPTEGTLSNRFLRINNWRVKALDIQHD